MSVDWEDSSTMVVGEVLFPDDWELSLLSPGACKDTSVDFPEPGPLLVSFLNAKAVVACPAISAEARAAALQVSSFAHRGCSIFPQNRP